MFARESMPPRESQREKEGKNLEWLGMKLNRPYNPKHWSKVGSVYFLRIHTLDETQSLAIMNGLDNRKLYFDMDGHVWTNVLNKPLFENPLATNPPFFDPMQNVVEMNADGLKAYLYSKDLIPNRNSTYLLHQRPDGIYELLYNPMHRRVFRDKWALDSGGKLNTRAELMEYCDSLATTSGEARRKHYVDPACGIAYNQSTCVGTALLGDAVKHTHALKENLWSTFAQSSVNALGQGTPLRCACQGPAFEWARQVQATDENASSFMSKYETHPGDPRSRLRHCTADNILINDCDITFESQGNINAMNSDFRCYNMQSSHKRGGNIPANDSSTVDNTPNDPAQDPPNPPNTDKQSTPSSQQPGPRRNLPLREGAGSNIQETEKFESSGENIPANDSSAVDHTADYTPINDPAQDPQNPSNTDKQSTPSRQFNIQEMDKFGLSPSILVILGLVAVLFILLT